MEKELEQLVAAWEKQQGHPFLISGKRLTDYIVDQWHQYHHQKEQEKEKKVSVFVSESNMCLRMCFPAYHNLEESVALLSASK